MAKKILARVLADSDFGKVGDSVEVTRKQLEAGIGAGQLEEVAAADSEKIKARVLVDCAHGKINALVEVTPEVAQASAGELDTSDAAVAYAETLAAETAAAKKK